MSEYTRICVKNMLRSAWRAFILCFLIVISCLLEYLLAYFNVYMKVGGTFLVRCGKGDNSARHCFVLTDLNPTNFFKYVIIMKMCTTDKIFYKICLKASRDIFFQMLSAIKGGMGWDIKKKGRTQCPAIATNREPP